MLLSGHADILATFDVALEDGARRGCSGCASRRASPSPRSSTCYVDVDAADRIRAILVLDAQGNRSQFAFDDIRENVGLDDRLFRFEVPRGVEVIAG